MIADKCPVCGAELWCTLPSGEAVFECGKKPGDACLNAERVAIERAAEITRLKAKLKQMIDFFDDYTALSEHGQSKVDEESDNLLASARESLTEPKPNQEK